MAYTKYPHPTNKDAHGDGTLPIFPQLDGSSIEWVDDLVTDRTLAGTAKSRAAYPSKKRNFRVLHRIQSSDLAAFETFYNTYRKVAFYFTWAGGGSEVLCRFRSAPRLTWTNTRVEIQSDLLEV